MKINLDFISTENLDIPEPDKTLPAGSKKIKKTDRKKQRRSSCGS